MAKLKILRRKKRSSEMEATKNRVLSCVFYLPLKDNDRIPFKASVFERVRRELTNRFSGCTYDPHPRKGSWIHRGVLYEDDVVTFEVWFTRNVANMKWLSGYKKTLMRRFKQKAIGLKLIPLETMDE